MSNIGWQRVSLELPGNGANIVLPKIVNVRGFGLRVIAGGQYIGRLVLYRGDESQGSELLEDGDIYDGRVKACTSGFTKLELWPRDENPQAAGVCRVVLEVASEPSIVYVEGEGLECKAAVRMFPTVLNAGSRLHPLAGEVAHHILAIGASVKVAEFSADGYQIDNDPANGKFRSRTIGSSKGVWYPSPSIYFYGAIFCRSSTTDSLSIMIAAHHYDGNGAKMVFPWTKIVTGQVVASTSIPYYVSGSAFDKVYPLAWNGANFQPLPVPPNGFEVWVENTGAGEARFAGFIGARSQ